MTRYALPFAMSCLCLGCVPDADLPLPEADSDSDSDSDDADEGSSETGTPATCPAGAGPTVHANNVDSDEVWRAEDGPHVIANDLTIHAEVVVDPCARVQLGAGVTLSIGSGGSLEADGEPGRVVTFERHDARTPWSSISVTGGTLALVHAELLGGGDPLNRSPWMHGAVVVRGRAETVGADPTLSVHDVVIRDSLTQGVRLEERGGFSPDSEQLVVVGAGAHPISAEVDSADMIPTGEYTGNADDRIQLTTIMPVSHDMTLAERGVPYYVGAPTQGADLRVFDQGGLATLTIEPGVELQFARGGMLRTYAAQNPTEGAIVAIGTPDAPIVLTSAEPTPAPGDWFGILFEDVPAAHNRLQHVVVEYAGGDRSGGSNSCVYDDEDPINEAAIRIMGTPASQFITDTTIVASANHGIDRGWRDDIVFDFVASNDFVDVARCRQTVPRNASGACPAPVPCE